MCYIFNCFGWALDFIQRTLTFIFACILCFVVTVGVVIAIAAGIAYGYNYSMAEFLTLTRQDVTVYMRRGQFYDKPDFSPDITSYRRSGSESGSNKFDTRKSLEYEDSGVVGRSNIKSLPESWSQVKDMRKYAKVLKTFTRKPVVSAVDTFSSQPPGYISRIPNTEWSTPLLRQLAQLRRDPLEPNPLMATTLIQSGNSQIVMRNFHASTQRASEEPDYRLEQLEEKAFYNDDSAEQKFYPIEVTRATVAPATYPPIGRYREQKASLNAKKIPYDLPMRHWTKKSDDAEYREREDLDEDNVVYKPV